mmetsp:Transcript_8304/g.12787  ORF Transcript_8304/g.12787 Transcript_8304/m.12787 type:complete len:572 (-) Transcript_8304:141-1856(-)
MLIITTIFKLASFLLLARSTIGKASSRSLIYGGDRVESRDKYPFFAQIVGQRGTPNEFWNETIKTIFTCGGALVAKDVVLTKGWGCIFLEGAETLALRVILGSIEADDFENRTIINAANWTYDDSQEADEERAPGLIFLEEDVDGYGFSPINVKVGNSHPQVNQELTIMGFGLTPEDTYYDVNSDYLNEVNVVVNDLAQCNAIFVNDTLVLEEQFCAGGLGKGGCFGDSGAPAIDADGEIVGLVSFGDGNCGAWPTVFVRVGGYTDYLKANLCGRPGKDDPEWCSTEPGTGDLPPPPVTPPGFCFAGSSYVQVQNENRQLKTIAMKDLSIGDMVNVGENTYEPVYSFGHYSPLMESEVLQIKTNSRTALRLSPNHLIMTASRGALPASQLRIGDMLLTGAKFEVEQVMSINTVRATGMFAPFTPSGKIVVDGILASTYVALEGTRIYEDFAGFKISHQWMAHAGVLPHRIMCYYMRDKFCEAEKYTVGGISTGIYGSLLLCKNITYATNQASLFVRYLLVGSLMAVLLLFSFVEFVITNLSPFCMLLLVLFCIIGQFCRGNTSIGVKIKRA